MMSKIGLRIKAIRKQKGLTQKELGERLNVSGAMIAQYETGKRKPKKETIEQIAKALDVPSYDLLLRDSVDSRFEEINDIIKSLNLGVPISVDKENKEMFISFPTDESIQDFKKGQDKTKLLDCYDSLNSLGKKEALKRVDELTLIEKYTKKDPGNDNQDQE